MRAKTSKGVQKQNCRRSLLIPPFYTSQAHFLQSKPIFFNLAHFPSLFMAQTLAHQQAQVWLDSAPMSLHVSPLLHDIQLLLLTPRECLPLLLQSSYFFLSPCINKGSNHSSLYQHLSKLTSGHPPPANNPCC